MLDRRHYRSIPSTVLGGCYVMLFRHQLQGQTDLSVKWYKDVQFDFVTMIIKQSKRDVCLR